MEVRAQLLADDVLRPVFRVRFWLYVVGVVFSPILVWQGSPFLLIPLTIAGTALAWWQLRTMDVVSAWLFDNTVAIAFTAIEGGPLGIAIVVGWGAIVGLVDTRHHWVYPLVSGAAAAVSMALIDGDEFAWTVRPIARALAVAVVVIFFLVMFRRIGERLRSTERDLRAFFERVPVALTRTTTDGRLLEFNRAAAEMFENAEFSENVIDRYVDPAERQGFVDRLAADGVVQRYEATLRTGPETTIVAVAAANAITDDRGELQYIETAILDATPMHKLEAEREMLARVIDSTSDLVALGGWDGSVQYANAAAREWVRRYITDGEFVSASQLVSVEDYELVTAVLRQAGEWSGTLAVEGRDQPRIVNVSFQVLEMGGEYSISTIARDVTDEVETQRQLKDLVRAKDELVASISHEIRTPLSVVLGLASELSDSHEDFDASTHGEFASLIAEQGQEMAHIVEDLLVAARADAGSIILDPAQVDLRHEAEMTMRSIAQIDRPDNIVNDLTGTCWGDPARVRQILRNLIINARRYGGDLVTLTAQAVEGGWVAVEVVDNGPGVAVESADAIFEPFARAHSSQSQPASIGLGLSVSRDLANRMGGDLTYTRRNDKTVFTLTLPGSQHEAAQSAS
jgi:signal transduction histidine kinase